ncbi:MAG: peroxiredoxin, partial [Oliverpabstia sp.]|nr:peroxiredoxin [Oliverpabstia sp.]
MLEIGTKAPGFELPDQNGNVHTLEEYKGKKVILYFYPKDNTLGCSKQAQGYSSLVNKFESKGITIIGVSKDSVKSHKNFEEKQNLSGNMNQTPILILLAKNEKMLNLAN